MKIQNLYQETIKFATFKHIEKNQTVPGTNLPYVVHLSNVAMEIFVAYQNNPDFSLNFAIQLALLHDTLEDTNTNFDELVQEFGYDIAQGVQALTKNKKLFKSEQMADSLKRINEQPKEVAAVKLADRITNLQKPPVNWDSEKIENYYRESMLILQYLGAANHYLEQLLSEKIIEYKKFT